MKQQWFLLVLVWALAALSESQVPAKDARSRQLPSESSQPRQGAPGLLERAEQDANRLEGPMRAWALWQVARAYQPTDKKKALELLDTALAEVAVMKDTPTPKMQERLTRAMNGGTAQSTKAWLQEQIGRTVVMVDPSRADELLQTLDASGRGPILKALLSYYEKNKLTDRAIEQFYRISAENEAPYAAAGRIMASLKPEQSSEIAGIFGACVTSYRTHATHDFPSTDEFPGLVATYWRKVPKQLARDAIDEVIQQAQESKANSTYAIAFDQSGGSVGSLLEYRLLQLMPALNELEQSKAKEYVERFPSLSRLGDSYAASASSSAATDGEANSRPGFRVSGDSGNLFMNMAERPMAEKIAARADGGDVAGAVTDAANIGNPDLRVQALEYIARVTMKKDATAAASALAKMLAAVEKLNLDRQPGYYSSAASIFVAMGDLESARQAVEKGLVSAGQLYGQDTDSDDPNTALEAFWPSTNAYCVLLRQARRISETWAVGLLKGIDDPKIRAAAEAAIACSALNVPESQTTMITAKRKGFRMSLGADSPAGSKD